MKSLIFLFTCLLVVTVNGQISLPPKIYNAPIDGYGRIIDINVNSNDFVRILDSVELNNDFKIPPDFKINSIWRLGDSTKLVKLGLAPSAKL